MDIPNWQRWFPQFQQWNWVFVRGFQRFEESENRNSAAVLTLTSLFGVVPFLTVLSFALSWVPEMQGLASEVRSKLFAQFAPATVSNLEEYFDGFAQQTQKLTMIGFLVLMLSALVALKNIEKAFNKVWRIPRGRTGMSGFLLYWAVLSLGPLLLGAGFFITSYLFSVPFVQSASQWSLGQELLSWLPLLLSAIAFTLLYAAVPNCKVPFSKALMGGFLVAGLFEVAKHLFTLFVTSFPSYRLIYGAFAILPLFIIWVYLCWCIVLLGMEWVYLMSRPEEADPQAMRLESMQALRVLSVLWKAQKEHPWVKASDAMLGLNHAQSESLLKTMLSLGWIARSEQDRLAFIRDPKKMNVYDVLFEGPWPVPRNVEVPENAEVSGWEQRISELISKHNQVQKERFDISLDDLFDQAE